MGTGTLIRHGTNAGYRAELATGEPCARCRNAHRVFDTQYSARGKRERLKYGSNDVIDHLYKPGRKSSPVKTVPNIDLRDLAATPPETPVSPPTGPEQTSPSPSLGDRLADRIRSFTIGEDNTSPYVEDQDIGYVHTIDDVDDPGPDWQPAEDTEYVINAAGLKKIEDNLGTYLSIVGITVEMIDPFCGPIFASNFDNIVKHWSKVIAHYPKAAELFLEGKGGVVFTWISALQATWPFLYAIYQHHLAKTVKVMPNGQVFHKNQTPSSNGQTVDALTPEFQYSAT